MRKRISSEVLDFWENFDRMMTEKQNVGVQHEPRYLYELRLPNQ